MKETKTKSPQQTNSRRRRKQTSKNVNVTTLPTELPEQEPTMEKSEETKRPMENLSETVPNSVFELKEENWVKNLWEEVRKANESKDNKGKTPIIEVNLDKKQACIDLVTKFTDTEPNPSSISKALSIMEPPSFIEPKVSNKEMLRIPSQYHPSLIVMDTANIQALMSTPIKVTLTLAELLKVKPELWQEITMPGKDESSCTRVETHPSNKGIN